MAKYFRCRCSEYEKPIEQRNWLITQHMWNNSAYIKRPGVWSMWSTVECGTCGEFGRTKSNYVYKLQLANGHGLKSIKTSRCNIPQYVRFIAVDRGGLVYGFESRPSTSEFVSGWVKGYKSFYIGTATLPDDFTKELYIYKR